RDDRGPGARGRVHTAYVGIPLELFRPEPPLPSGDGLALLCVARLAETKGLATLVDACALLRDRRVRFRLRLYGDGPLRQALAARPARPSGPHARRAPARSAYDRAPPPPSDALGRAAGRGRGGGPELSLPRGVPHGLSTWKRGR